MQKNLTIALDIDNTLINKKGKLDKNVYALFQKADLDRTNFIFLTGNCYACAKNCLKQINDILPSYKKITGYIATSCGSRIYAPEGQYFKDGIFCKGFLDFPMDKEYVKDLFFTTKDLDMDSLMVFRSCEKNYIETRPVLTVDNLIVHYCKLKEAKKGKSGLKFNDLKGEYSYIFNEDIHSIFVNTLDKKLKQTLLQRLQTTASFYSHTEKQPDLEYQVYNGRAIQIPSRTKSFALSKILELDTKNDMPKNPRDVIYFGNGNSDIELLQNSRYSFARGEDIRKEVLQVSKYNYINLDKVADDLYGDEENFEQRMEDLPETDNKNYDVSNLYVRSRM